MSTLFGKTPQITPQAPARMPDPEDPAVVEAKRKAVADAMLRGGRSSTILTGKNAAPAQAQAGATGSDTYSAKTLG